MKVCIPGFPSDVTPPIELPDIGELLMYPAFQGIDADTFFKQATDFQRTLLSKVPLKHDRRNVLVRSGVWLLEPGTRSHVNTEGDWHIDGNTESAHIEPDERVFILSSPCSALTEFNEHPLRIESPATETRHQLTHRICQSPAEFGVHGRSIEPCRIYAFENHLHRAVEPRRVEFRYFLRVRETDVPPSRSGPLPRVFLRTIQGQDRPHIEYAPDKVSIYMPAQLRSRQNSA